MNKFCIVPILDDKELSLTDIAVWFALCSFAKWTVNAYGNYVFKANNMFPSMKTLANRAHCSVSSAKRSIHKFERLGYVKITQGIGNSNSYTIDLLWLGEEFAIAGKARQSKVTKTKGAGHRDKKSVHSDTGGRSQSHPNKILNNINNNILNNTEPNKFEQEKTEPEEIDKAEVMRYVMGESENQKRERIEKAKEQAAEMLRALAAKFAVNDSV